ncbi:hypothetical protein ABZ383_18950 [Streptomyces sp. NPDC005900]|uniref:hypothetical protein n=1 Tax=Streptomyces sp. NPDC005900 TaxID=3154569 RepID=UPI0033EBD03D
MYKRLPVLALCLAAADLGTSACDDDGDDRPRASASEPSTTASEPSAGASTSAPSAAEPRKLTGVMSKLYLKTIRDHYPDLADIDDATLLAHGNAFCAARGKALGDQAKKTMREIDTTPKQTAQIMGTAHGLCR